MEREIRIWLMGTECELRPLSAGAGLRARKNARELLTELGGNDGADRLIEGAGLIAEGLYEGEKRVFDSPMEVLDALSPEQILELAAEYGELFGPEGSGTGNYKGAPGDTVMGNAAGADAQGRLEEYIIGSAFENSAPDADELGAILAGSGDEENSDPGRWDVTHTETESGDVRTSAPADGDRSSLDDEYLLDRRVDMLDSRMYERRNPQRQTRGGETAPSNKSGPATGTGPGGEPAYGGPSASGLSRVSISSRQGLAFISEFFERDSRRYDGSFTFY